MQKIKKVTLFLYRHHFVRYLIVGGSTFTIDFAILVLLHGKFGFGIAASTSVAYWLSIIYNFTLNRYWTFDAWEKQSLQQHIMAYLMLLIINYFFAVTFVSFASDYINYIYAKAMSVLIQMLWTFPVYKYLIFTKSK